MQITDRFDGSGVTVIFQLDRSSLEINVSNDDYMAQYLKAQENYCNEQLDRRRRYSVYDLCVNMHLQPKPMYAYLGWKMIDIIRLDYRISSEIIELILRCNYL